MYLCKYRSNSCPLPGYFVTTTVQGKHISPESGRSNYNTNGILKHFSKISGASPFKMFLVYIMCKSHLRRGSGVETTKNMEQFLRSFNTRYRTSSNWKFLFLRQCRIMSCLVKPRQLDPSFPKRSQVANWRALLVITTVCELNISTWLYLRASNFYVVTKKTQLFVLLSCHLVIQAWARCYRSYFNG